ncbi:glycosyltransferase [uncultured Sporomusa sp.]|uniref:glycosyltransferase family 2 protein n=1 Tax=uncultured Sporomusa sp. TaxID=307249 RepID=UPI00258626F8|nr:glycosyltransferase [uncultured Sporomusa sp.]
MPISIAKLREGKILHEPLVTVAIPAFNRPFGLQRTLKLITEQTYQNLEIIVADDCSTGDETQTIMKDFASKDKRVICYRHEKNIGMFNNFKFLLNKASGEYFMWAADDDEWSPKFIAACMERFTESIVSVMCGINIKIRGSGREYNNTFLNISPKQGIYENAMIFLNDMQSSLFYGIHRKKSIEWIMKEQPFDWFDCYLVLRQIFQNGYEIIPEYLFTAGIDGETYIFKPYYPSPGRVFVYYPFYKACSDLILNETTLSTEEKRRLLFRLTRNTLSNFNHCEQEMQKQIVRLPYDIQEQYLLDEKI